VAPKVNLRYLRPSHRPVTVKVQPKVPKSQRGFIPIGLIIKFLPYIALFLMILGGYLYYKHLVNTIERQKQQIVVLEANVKDLESKLTDCQAANVQYQTAIQDINKTVNKLIDVSEQQQKTMLVLKGQITNERAQKNQLIGELTDLKKRPLAQTCEAAIQELVDGIKDYTTPTPTPSGGVPQ